MRDNVLSYLEETYERMPEKTAVVDEKESCTWEELYLCSRGIGAQLSVRTRSGRPIPVLMDKTVLTIEVFMGIVTAGCFYVMLNPELPDSRLSQILQVLGSDILITETEHLETAKRLMDPSGILIADDDAAENSLIRSYEVSEEDALRLQQIRRGTTDTLPLYIQFTSGSTGVPKGVVVAHRSVIDFIDHFTDLFGIDASDRLGCQAPLDFDVSVKDIYPALKTGAALVLIPRRLFSSPAALLDYLEEHGVTNLTWAVSALSLISTFHGLDYKTPHTIRRVMFSGEVMPEKHLKDWMRHLPDALFVNLYGPTEITCNCTYHVIDRERDYSAGIPIGGAFPNERILLLDGEGKQVVEAGEVGEICVAGTALALGYYNNPVQTEKHFIRNPLNPYYPEMIYCTGDLGHMGEDGELYFDGRKDFQIKHRGHRIELEEIERAISRLDGVEQACCVYDEKRSRLMGFYVGTPEEQEVLDRLHGVIPEYMIPNSMRSMEQMPLTKNGKIDRRALAELRRRRRGDKT